MPNDNFLYQIMIFKRLEYLLYW